MDIFPTEHRWATWATWATWHAEVMPWLAPRACRASGMVAIKWERIRKIIEVIYKLYIYIRSYKKKCRIEGRPNFEGMDSHHTPTAAIFQPNIRRQ